MPVFTESGTYAPVYKVGTWLGPDRQVHMFIVDGYSASAEAIQAITLAPILGLDGSLVVQDEVSYGDRDQWPVLPDGLGPSLELIDASAENGEARAWAASTAVSGWPVRRSPTMSRSASTSTPSRISTSRSLAPVNSRSCPPPTPVEPTAARAWRSLSIAKSWP